MLFKGSRKARAEKVLQEMTRDFNKAAKEAALAYASQPNDDDDKGLEWYSGACEALEKHINLLAAALDIKLRWKTLPRWGGEWIFREGYDGPCSNTIFCRQVIIRD